MLHPMIYWNEVFFTSIYIINRLPIVSLNDNSLFEHHISTSLDYSMLRVLRCLCYACLRPYNSHKLEPQSIPCTFLRYIPRHKGYTCLSSNDQL